MNAPTDMKKTMDTLSEQVRRLEHEAAELKQANEDLEIAYSTAIEHGDTIESELYATIAKLNDEVRERIIAERRLEQVVRAVKEQKKDLEAIVQTITEHSDGIDSEWLQRYEEMESQALRDPLTGIPNRRAFDENLSKEWQKCAHHEQPLGLLFGDIDHFKEFNDTYGHSEGDRALTIVANTLSQVCRKQYDLVARVGGEEFAVLLRGVDADVAASAGEKALEAIRAQAVPHEKSPHGILTMSFGITSVTPTKDLDPIEDFYTRADVMLYKAKQAGRNRICLSK
ncbi:MAG: GGDEF domain-containing protein [Rhodospirillaceae bacterium]